MPWDIRREGKSYAVVQRNNGKTVGTHATRASAERQQAALYASENNEAKKSMNLYEMLTPVEKAYHDALVNVVSEHGPFDKGSQSVWVGYEKAADNEKASIGVKCSNCSFYGEGGSCKIVSFLVEADAYCRLAAIPDGLVTAKADIELGKGLGVGSMVSWGSSGGTARGKIKRIIRNGKYNVPNSDFTITGTEDDPAAVIEVYRDGKPSGTMVGHKLKTLRSSSSTTKSLWGGSFDPRGYNG